ncbi:unnamed protein product [Ambrosiozyma monospora]|uniref:[RNA-polymerase]-subunit kinase n=1 Tax=Ambrosiozyma monospora TaxID=43982 RepID=A0A9W6STN8_AMBMO|nr:unnamed protein product [Ambrosiozyma monospora]
MLCSHGSVNTNSNNPLKQSQRMADRYSKNKKVGEGTYAVVYLGTQLSTNRSIAIKEIKTENFKDGLDMSAIREMKYLQELKHENIIELVDVFSDDNNNLNLVLEFLPSDLQHIIKDNTLTFKLPDGFKAGQPAYFS